MQPLYKLLPLVLFISLLSACGDTTRLGDSNSNDSQQDNFEEDDRDGSYSIGGSVSGLVGTLVLTNNSEDSITIDSDGRYTFLSELTNNDSYKVEITTQPDGQVCVLSNESGEVVGADIANVDAVCDGFAVAASMRYRSIDLYWSSEEDASYYRVMVNPDGESGFSQYGDDLSADTTQFTLPVSVHLTDWVNARYMIEACNDLECIGSNELSSLDATDAIGFLRSEDADEWGYFGFNVVLSGDGTTLVVNDVEDSSSATGIDGDAEDERSDGAGAVFVFTLNEGSWSQQAYIKASNSGAEDNFGFSLALSDDGNILAVSAPYEDSNALGLDGDGSNDEAEDAGAVYLFSRNSEGVWQQEAYIKASNTEKYDRFGYSVALSDDGNTLAVGADGESSSSVGIDGDGSDNSARFSGAVYVFNRGESGWSQQAYLKGSDTEALDGFGESVSLSADGNTLAIGAPYEGSAAIGVNGDETDNSAFTSGAVYLFSRTDSLWTQHSYLKPSNTDEGDYFGGPVVLSDDGTTLAVGAVAESSSATGVNGDDVNNDAEYSGAVYLFTHSEGVWAQQAYIKAINTDIWELFGYAIDLSENGDLLAVSTPLEMGSSTGVGGDHTDNEGLWDGAVYLYERNEGEWSFKTYVKSSDEDWFEYFGSSVSLSNDGSSMAVGSGFAGGAFLY